MKNYQRVIIFAPGELPWSSSEVRTARPAPTLGSVTWSQWLMGANLSQQHPWKIRNPKWFVYVSLAGDFLKQQSKEFEIFRNSPNKSIMNLWKNQEYACDFIFITVLYQWSLLKSLLNIGEMQSPCLIVESSTSPQPKGWLNPPI